MVAMAHGVILEQEPIPPGTTCVQPGLYGTQDGGWGVQSLFGLPTLLLLTFKSFLPLVLSILLPGPKLPF